MSTMIGSQATLVAWSTAQRANITQKSWPERRTQPMALGTVRRGSQGPHPSWNQEESPARRRAGPDEGQADSRGWSAEQGRRVFLEGGSGQPWAVSRKVGMGSEERMLSPGLGSWEVWGDLCERSWGRVHNRVGKHPRRDGRGEGRGRWDVFRSMDLSLSVFRENTARTMSK